MSRNSFSTNFKNQDYKDNKDNKDKKYKLQDHPLYDEKALVDSNNNYIIFDVNFNFDEAEYKTFKTEYLDKILNSLGNENEPFLFLVKKKNQNNIDEYHQFVYNGTNITKRTGPSNGIVNLIENKLYSIISNDNFLNPKDSQNIIKNDSDGGYRRYRSYRSYRGRGGNKSISDLIPGDGHGLKALYNDPDKDKSDEEIQLMGSYVNDNIDKLELYIEINNNEELKNFINTLLIEPYLSKKNSKI
jgi:hypothetical protein